MSNQLENLCKKTGIMVEFISNKFIDDGDELKYSKPIIKVHKIFKECPIHVATAIVEVFTEESKTSECIDIIEKYLKEKFGPVGIKIKTPKPIIRNPVNREVINYNKENQENYYINEDLYVEGEIFSIDVTGIKDNQKRLKDNETVSLREQNILELDIVASPPLHK